MNRLLFAERHPYWFVAILEAVVILVYLLAGTIAHFMHLSNLGLYGIANLGLTMIAALLLTVMRWWKAVGFRSAGRPKDLLYYIVPFLPLVINLIPGVEVTSTLHLAQILAITLMVGFTEEAVFRGLMLNPLKARGFWKAAIITSLLFGLTHAMNVLTGKSVAEDVAQISYAVAIGFAYAALVLKKGLLWPLVLAHFLIDFTNFIQAPGFTFPPVWNLLIVVGITLIFTAYGLFLMLQKGEEQVKQP
jgi:membrane protease YdiL (CAAX protease family)